MNNFFSPVFFATIIGTVASIFAVIFFARWFVRKTAANRVVTITTFLITMITYPFSWFLGYIVGGNFGGAIASSIPVNFISISIFISIGIGVGIFLFTLAISLIATICGFSMGQLLDKAIK